MRLLAVDAIAGLRSFGKGANKIPDRAARPSPGQAAAGLPAAVRRALEWSKGDWAKGGLGPRVLGGLQRGWTDRQDGKGS
jgi:hypothetical protein